MSTLNRFVSRWQNIVAITIVGFFVLAAIAAPRLSPPDDPANPSPYRVVGKVYDQVPQPPSENAPLGTVSGQLDIYHTLVWGTRSALRFGLIVALSAATIGVMIGAVSGYLGGPINGLTMRVTDAFLTFPIIAGVWLFRQILLPDRQEVPLTWVQRTLLNFKVDPVMLTLILFSWMAYARIINTNITQLKKSEYVSAAKVVGAGNTRIITRHLLPNVLAPAIVLVARDIGAVVVLEAAFTFIGIGGSTEWSILLTSGRDYIIGMRGNPLAYWWVFLPATLTLVLFGVGWNLLGDGLNDALNPRSGR
jgi:peptide/nickel transport system permease protein